MVESWIGHFEATDDTGAKNASGSCIDNNGYSKDVQLARMILMYAVKD